jgi:protein TIF31
VSVEDSIQVIIQSLGEAAETCFITCYSLEVDGKKIDEFTTLSEIPDLKPHSTFTMLEGTSMPLLLTLTYCTAQYDEKAARLHIKRLREILSSAVKLDAPNTALLPFFSTIDDSPLLDLPSAAPTPLSSSSSSVSSLASSPSSSSAPSPSSASSAMREAMESAESEMESALPLMQALQLLHYCADCIHSNTSLSAFFPKPRPSAECVKRMNMSGWNPPPGNRKLQGDLFYLEIETLEGRVFHVTAATEGFYVNECTATTFNPTPSLKYSKCYNLVHLLEQVNPHCR